MRILFKDDKFFLLQKPANSKLALLHALKLSTNKLITLETYQNVLSTHNVETLQSFSGVFPVPGGIGFKSSLLFKSYGIKLADDPKPKPDVPLEFPDKVQALILAYNRTLVILRQRVGGSHAFAIKDHPFMPKKAKLYNRIINSLNSQGIEDYYIYIYALLLCNSFSRQVLFSQLGSDYSFIGYQKFRNQAVDAQSNSSNVVYSSRWLDVYPHIEAKKAKLLKRGNQQVCINSYETLFGFHPKSENCKGCPLSTECAGIVQKFFETKTGCTQNLVDLRNGKIKPEIDLND